MASNHLKTTLDLDSHANISCLGGGALILFNHETPVHVQGYDPTLGTKEYQLVSGAVAYTESRTGQQFHLVVHQAVHIPDLNHHLL